MAEYKVYRDWGDFGREYVCNAVSVRDVLGRIVRDSKGGDPCEFTVRLHGDWLATVTLDAFGNYSAEVLERRDYPADAAYSVGVWATYWLSGTGEWHRGGCEQYHDCTGE